MLINIKTDSHWIFSIKSEDELHLLLNNIPRMILILFDKESIETDDIRLRAWAIDPKNKYVREFFNDYFYNNYMKKTNPAPCNLHPLKFDFVMMKPELIFYADIDIENKIIEIKYWNVQNPKLEKIPIGLLNKKEIIKIFKEELERGMNVKEIIEQFPYVPNNKIEQLEIRKKILKTYINKYRRR